MDLILSSTIKSLLQKYSAAPQKRFGQNFLINRGVLQKIIEAADLSRKDVVLEIGPGLGTLTHELASRAKKIIAVEKDRKFVAILKETLKEHRNVEIIHADILSFKPKAINYKLIANLPYNITSPVIRKFLEENDRPKEMILMVQKEVAQRICAQPPDMSLLAVSVQFYAEPKILSYVSKGSFWPPPKVDSAILEITPKKELPDIDAKLFFKIVHAGFSAPRKQLAGNLSKNLKIERNIIEDRLKKAGINPRQRAETLNIEDWTQLTSQLAMSFNP